MLRNIFLLIVLTTPLISVAQISLEHTYTGNTSIGVKYLSNGGQIYTAVNASTLNVYSSTHQLLTSIPMYIPPNYSLYVKESIVSDNLFNADNLIELVYSTESIGGNTPDSTFVVNSNGVINGFEGFLGEIIKSGNDFKLLLRRFSPSQPTGTDIYALPGTYPCDACSNLSSTMDVSNYGMRGSSSVAPNPSNSMLTLKYQLPDGINSAEIVVSDMNGQDVSTYKVGRDFKEIYISTEKLNSGTYMYRILNQGIQIGLGKFIVTK